jgi:hypothetical protein
MDKEIIDQLWKKATRESTDKSEKAVRHHFAEVLAAEVIKHSPDYQWGYADGEFAERERLTKLLQEGGK